MKRIIISVVIASFSCSSFSAGMNIGVELSSSNNDFTAELAGNSADFGDDSTGYALQFGINTGASNTLTTFFEYKNEEFDDGLYDNENNALHYFSVGLLKEFPQTNSLSPYIRGSVGYGFMSVDKRYYDDDTVNAAGIKAGAGLAFYPASTVKIYGGVDFQYRVWSSIDTGTVYGDIDIDETSFMFSAGASYLF